MEYTSRWQKIFNRFFVVGITIAVVLAFQVHGNVQAAGCPAINPGDLFKVQGVSSIYLLNSDGERMYFPNSDTFHTYYESFSAVDIKETTQLCAGAYPAATNPAGVPYRAGSRLIKTKVSSKVYGVGFGGKRFLVPDAETAEMLYGSDWTSFIRDVHDFHWSNYSPGPKIIDQEPHDGMLVSVGNTGKSLYIQDIYAYHVKPNLPSWAQKDARFISNKAYSNLVEIDEEIKTFSPDDILTPPIYARQTDTIGHNEPAFGFSLELPTLMDGYWVEKEQSSVGWLLRFRIDALGTNFEENGTHYEPFLIHAIDRDWWYANADQTNPPKHMLVHDKNAAEQQFSRMGYYLGENQFDVFIYTYNEHACPHIGKKESSLCSLQRNAPETMDSLLMYEPKG